MFTIACSISFADRAQGDSDCNAGDVFAVRHRGLGLANVAMRRQIALYTGVPDPFHPDTPLVEAISQSQRLDCMPQFHRRLADKVDQIGNRKVFGLPESGYWSPLNCLVNWRLFFGMAR
jgi:hypothetical protein